MCTFADEMEENLTNKTCKEQALYLLESLRNRVSTPISTRKGTTIPKYEVEEWADLLAAVYGSVTHLPNFITEWLERCDDVALSDEYCSSVYNDDSDFAKAVKAVQGWKDKKVTCGFFILRKSKMLAMLPTGRKPGYGQYDIPKGCCEPGESHLETAKRELMEETSINLDEVNHTEIVDYGVLPYNKEKDIHMFSTCILSSEEPVIKCTSMFTNDKGKELPEMCDYKWTDDLNDFFQNIGKACTVYDKYRFCR